VRADAELAEARAVLEAALDALDHDPRRLETIEERLYALRGAARKYSVTPDELETLRKSLAERLAEIEDGDGRLAKLVEAVEAARHDYRLAAKAVSAARRAAAERLERAVAAELAPLKLERAAFRVRIEPLAEADGGPHGLERIVFEVATNPGSPFGPLSRIASGGELSRFVLALKVALAAQGAATTLIFDEIDRGVGGAVADAVGERLARLAETAQVLVVTHSPQVAARARNHLRIDKRDGAGGVVTHVETLAATGRREEIARMLAGARVTDEARAAARRLIEGLPT
jgi:DNA repair protein RecN (Recombination protein N)